MADFPKLDEGAEPKKHDHPWAIGGPVTGHWSSKSPAFGQVPKKDKALLAFDLEASEKKILMGIDPASMKGDMFAVLYGMQHGKTLVMMEALATDFQEKMAAANEQVQKLAEALLPLEHLVPTLRPEKPWEAKLPQDRQQLHMNGFRTELTKKDPRRRRRAKAARKQRRRCR
jgi:hypothetical protein